MKSFREQQKDKENAMTQSNTELGQTVASLAAMNESDLTALLMGEAAKAKREGTLDRESMRAFYEQMAPMLTPDQRKKMADLLALIGGE